MIYYDTIISGGTLPSQAGGYVDVSVSSQLALGSAYVCEVALGASSGITWYYPAATVSSYVLRVMNSGGGNNMIVNTGAEVYEV